MWSGVLIITVIALFAGVVLGYAESRLPERSGELANAINDMLPQTQCAQCGYPGCRPYAEAIAAGDADINLCPPGGEETVRRLANLLGREPVPLAADAPGAPLVAIIDEAACIGCFHCRNACPVDAIVGAHHLMHTVISSECTGCELCIAPCPVDCISMRAAS